MTEDSSRWESLKSRSNWHFDTKRPPQSGTDSFTHVCRFDEDFSEAIAHCMGLSKLGSWAEDKLGKQAQQDLINHGADLSVPMFHQTVADEIELFQKINRYLGIENSTIRFHNQTTGQIVHTHFDNFGIRYKQTDIVRRFAIMLSDWQLGQIFQLGNANFTQWHRGDCITWEWQDIPHSTANMGWWDRPMLQITGVTTTRTQDVLGGAGKNLVVKL
jgi:hypothetical protein